MTQEHQRIYTFDLLRGLAVLTMMLAHSVYFFHIRDSDFLLSVEGFGNTVSFVTFLLVSGAVASVSYFSSHQAEGQPKRKRVFKRVLLLLLAYYVLALVLTGKELLQAEGFVRLRIVLDIFSFRNLPGFTEYFPPFIFYSTLLIVIPKFFLMASKSLKNVIFFSLLSLLAGFVLYQLPAGPFLQPWVALLAGAEGLYRFPLLQYLPVFLVGLYWGHRMLAHQGGRAKMLLCFRFFTFFSLLAAAAFLGSFFLGVPWQNTFSRWPPSVPFLSLGLAFGFLFAFLICAFRQLRRLRLLRDLLLLFGQNALGLFWSHVFLLGLYAAADGPKVSSISLFLFLFLLLVLLSLALTTFLPFNFRLALTSVRGSREEREEELSNEAVFKLSKDVANDAALTAQGLRNYFFPNPRTTSRRTLRKRHKLGIALALFVASAFIYPGTVQEIALQRQQRGSDVWWSNTYAYRQPATLKNSESFITLHPGTPVAMSFNHKQLVDQGKSQADGRDIQLVYWTGDKHVVAQSYVENPGTTQAQLKFRNLVDIQAGKEDPFYYLYYGGFIDQPTQVAKLDTKSTILADFEPEEAYPLVASLSKTWNLIGTEGSETISFHLSTAVRHETQTVTYQVLDTEVSGNMIGSDDSSWEANIPVDKLPTGAYRIQATLHDGDRQQSSQLTGFYRSYPLYVAWTQDWEGYDASQAYLDAIEDIAKQYQLPITHFFNPRIYVTKTISPQRALALTQWVQRRIKLGDGYGLHLHMLKDFVEHVGIEPKDEPNWGDRGDGYGVPLSAYTKDEQIKMIADANNLLFANGLPKTTIFRAGGWYANLDTLAALEQLGFTADSSARTIYQFGRNRLPGYWNISATAKPYYPSRTNQNRSSGTNDFPILEIPNNGADSYAFSASDMINRFIMNIGNGILADKQQLTYLSHPHWFDEKEQARIRELFTYVSQYTFSNDRGPVIFTTTADIAKIWTDAE